LKGLTTGQVRQQILLPTTDSYQSSYCEMLKQTQQKRRDKALKDSATTVDIIDVVGPPNAFISRASSYEFIDVIQALAWHFRYELGDDGKNGVVVWVDLFSINQHDTHHADRSFDWLSQTFLSAIGTIGRLVMVMSLWNDPIPFTRTWCVYECYCSATTNKSSFEIAMMQSDQGKFVRDAVSNSDPYRSIIEPMLTNIRSQKSRASKEEDIIQIHAVIQITVGFHKLDSLVFERYLGWVIQVIESALQDFTKTDDKNNVLEQKLALKHTLGCLYLGQGKYYEAKSIIVAPTLTKANSNSGKTRRNISKLCTAWGSFVHKRGIFGAPRNSCDHA
jgi:hypothetical protein